MSGTLRLVPGDPEPAAGDPTATMALRVRPAPGSGPLDGGSGPLDELAREHADLCAQAVHPDQIAAVLEADGLTGEQIARRYGLHDVFEVAEELWKRVPRTHPEARRGAGPWRISVLTCLLRGLVFTLPGLAYALAAPFLAGAPGTAGIWGLPPGTAALVVSALVGWGWNQALAHRAYSALAAGGRAAAGRCLRWGGSFGVLLAFGSTLLLPAGGGPAGALGFAAGQVCYLAAATALLVLGRERLLLYTLLPMVAGAALLPVTGLPTAVRGVLLLCTLTAVVTAAVRETAGPGNAGADRLRLLASLPYGLFGIGCAVLTAAATLGDVLHYGTSAGVAGPVVVALTLSMGAAEWLLYRCRGTALSALARSRTSYGLRLRAAGTLALCLGGYLAVLAVLLAAGTLLWPDAPQLGTTGAAGVLALGAVLWTGLLLQALGTAWWPALLCLAAAGSQAALLVQDLLVPALAQLAVCGAASAVLAVTAALLLGRVTTHR